MKNLVISLTGLVLIWGLTGCAYPNAYYSRGYSGGYYSQSYPYTGYLYSRSYAPPFFGYPYRSYYIPSPYFRTDLHRARVHYGPVVKYHDPRFHGRYLHDGKARHRLTHPGHGKHFPGHSPGFHDGTRHGGKHQQVGRRVDNRYRLGPTIPIRVEHGVSLEHPVHAREKFTRNPRSGKPGFAAQGDHRAPAVKLRDSRQHGGSQSGRHLQSSGEHRRPVDDKTGFQAERRSPSSRVEFRGRGNQGHDRLRPERGERRNWRSRIFDRAGGASFCVGQRC